MIDFILNNHHDMKNVVLKQRTHAESEAFPFAAPETGAPLDYGVIEDVVRDLYIRALQELPPDVLEALERAHDRESHPTARTILQTILRSVALSQENKLLICQDTGLPIFQVTVGGRFPFDGHRLKGALSEGARRATQEFPFRGSSMHPLTRENPQTSVGPGLPVVLWEFLPEADYLEILLVPKGSGSENMSGMALFTPADGLEALKKFVVDRVVLAGGKPCPPGILGVGIGGSFESVGILAKKAVCRPLGIRNADPLFAALEEELEEAVNRTGIGPMGLGGDTTVLGVNVEWSYTHITQNPIAVNYQCWAARRARARIWPDGRVEQGF
ncbi:MAG: fumarate hydratase [Pirellulales bacterium]|nr:fumarate hydratase [Pirellulales bacterium]